MITAVDSNVFFDVLSGTAQQQSNARLALASALRQGVIVATVIVYGELSALFARQADLDIFLQSWRCVVEPLDIKTAHRAGVYFKAYRERSGERTRILPDFLIAAHAELYADRILTRDKRFFGESFPALRAVTPLELL